MRVTPGAPKKEKQTRSRTLDILVKDFNDTVQMYNETYGAGAGPATESDALAYERKYNALWRKVMSFFEDHLAQDSAMLRDKQQILDALVEKNHGDGMTIVWDVLSLLKRVKSIPDKPDVLLLRKELDDHVNIMPEDGLVTITYEQLDTMVHDVMLRHIGDDVVYGPDKKDVARVYDAMGIRGGQRKKAKKTRKMRKRKKKARRKTKKPKRKSKK